MTFQLPLSVVKFKLAETTARRKNCEAQKVKQLDWKCTERKERGRLNIIMLLSCSDPDIV